MWVQEGDEIYSINVKGQHRILSVIMKSLVCERTL